MDQDNNLNDNQKEEDIDNIEKIHNATRNTDEPAQEDVILINGSNTNERKKDEKSEEKNNISVIYKKKSKKKILVIFLVIFLIVILPILVFACLNKLNDTIYTNAYVGDIDLSGMTKSEAIQQIQKNVTNAVSDSKVEIKQEGKAIYEVEPDEIEYELDVEKTVNNAMLFGRDSNIFINNYNILKALIIGRYDVTKLYKYDDTKLDNVLKNIDLSLENRYEDDLYTVDYTKNVLNIKMGKSGNTIDYDKAKKSILDKMSENKHTVYDIEVISKKPIALDAEKIHDEIYKEAKDAYIDKSTDPVTFVREVVGIDFDVDKLNEELQTKKESESFEFPLDITEPKIKEADINYTLYNDKLAGYTTYFPSSNTNRSKNLEIALKYLNGVVIEPGETFSYQTVIGDTTTEKGYLPAATFKAGTVVDEIGGGICQTSSTLYYVALMANMEIVERHAHGLPVGYIKPSLDATIYTGTLDLRFKNTRKYPVKIVTSYSAAGSLNISIYGKKEDVEYDISLTSNYLYTIPYSTQYIYDNTMNEGEQVVVSQGVNGYASEAYITKSLNGNVVSSAKLSKDVYKPENAIVKVGTKKQEQTQQPVVNNTTTNQEQNIETTNGEQIQN